MKIKLKQVGISPKIIEDTTKLAILTLSPLYLLLLLTFLIGKLNVGISDLNALVFDYLLIEGFPTAAIEFARETGLPHDVDHASVKERMDIRDCVEDGRVEEAVRRVNELDPEVSPHFSLLSAVCGGRRGKERRGEEEEENVYPEDKKHHAPRLASFNAWPCGNNR